MARYSPRMFIRRTNTRNRKTGEAYFTHRLVEAVRVGAAVKQRTLLNLGAHFDLPHDDWAALAGRIGELLHGQAALLGVSSVVESQAQRYAAQLIARPGLEADAGGEAETAATERFQEVDLGTLDLVRPRCVGVEHAALTVLRQLGFEDKLAELRFNKPQIAASVGNVIGRMAAPASELATHDWLRQRTALGELIGYDYEGMSLQQHCCPVKLGGAALKPRIPADFRAKMGGVDFNSMERWSQLFRQKSVARGYSDAWDTDLYLHIWGGPSVYSIEKSDVVDCEFEFRLRMLNCNR